MTIYQAPQIEWQEPKSDSVLDCNDIQPIYHPDVVCFFANPLNSYFIRKNPDEKSPKPFVVAYGGRELKEMASVADAKEWVEQTHYPSALIKAGFKPVSEPLADTLIEKLEQERSRLNKQANDDIDVVSKENHAYQVGLIGGLTNAINIVKQHQAESEVQDD